MNEETANKLFFRFLSGEALSPDEERQVFEALEADPLLRERLFKDVDMDSLLSTLAREDGDGERFVRDFAHYLAAEDDAGRFVNRFRQRFEEAGTSSPPRPGRPAASESAGRRPTRRRTGTGASTSAGLFWGIALAAAAVLIAFTAIVTSSGAPAPTRPPREIPSAATPPSPERPPVPERPNDTPAPEVKKPVPTPEPVKRGHAPQTSPAPPGPSGAPAPPPGDRKRRIEEKMKKAIAGTRKKPDAPVAPVRPKRPSTTIPDPAPPVRVAVALLEDVTGSVEWTSGTETRAPRKDEKLLAGDSLAVGPDGAATLVYQDGTKVTLEADTRVERFVLAGGKRMYVARGTVRADVARQPPETPMVFATPDGEATVLGTTLRIVVEPDRSAGTRLEVGKGKVRLKNKASGKDVLVTGGYYALAAAGVPLAVRPSRLDEIVLRATEGRISGTDWRLVRDPGASAGFALEAPEKRSNDVTLPKLRNGTLGFVEFRFLADANLKYTVWIRGFAPVSGDKGYDGILLEAPQGTFGAPFRLIPPQRTDAAFFTAYCLRRGFWWGGDKDKTGPARFSPVRPVTLRFSEPGLQKVRLYPIETPMRIDAIWLSSARTTRPSPMFPVPKTGASK